MKINVTAKPSSKKPGITKIDDLNYIVAVKEPPVEGRANRAIEKALADFLNYPPYQVRIVSGFTSRQKIIEIV